MKDGKLRGASKRDDMDKGARTREVTPFVGPGNVLTRDCKQQVFGRMNKTIRHDACHDA